MFKKKPLQEAAENGRSLPGAETGAKTAASANQKAFLKKNGKKIIAVVCAAAVVGAFALSRMQAGKPAASVSYLEVTPEKRSITNVFSDSGTITAANTYEVKALVRGKVLSSDFEEGDVVIHTQATNGRQLYKELTREMQREVRGKEAAYGHS